jgi:hypothetical protein
MAHLGLMMVSNTIQTNMLNEDLESLHLQDLGMVDQPLTENIQNKQKQLTLCWTLWVSMKSLFMVFQVEALVLFILLQNIHRKLKACFLNQLTLEVLTIPEEKSGMINLSEIW